MNRPINFLLFLLFSSITNFAQFAPPAGQEGTTAIHKDSTVFIAWANSVFVQRGYLDISLPDSGFVSFGEEQNAIGAADNMIVSLGDGGYAILSFDIPLANGPGPDFAVFENAFTDDFLELAFVEVSSDGDNYFRFPAVSLTQTQTQVASFGTLDATKIHNLAGKYRIEYGTPFDLEDLSNTQGLNTDSITHVKIIDVVGCIQDEFASYDSEGHKVNDPWPTPFASGGFDLDAVGVIHNITNAGIIQNDQIQVSIYPNPVDDFVNIKIPNGLNINSYSLFNSSGNKIYHRKIDSGTVKFKIDMRGLKIGIYFLNLYFKETSVTMKILKRQ